MNRVFRGSTALVPFWYSRVGLSFVVFELLEKNGNVCDGAWDSIVSVLKSREGPFVNGVYKEVYEGRCD